MCLFYNFKTLDFYNIKDLSINDIEKSLLKKIKTLRKILRIPATTYVSNNFPVIFLHGVELVLNVETAPLRAVSWFQWDTHDQCDVTKDSNELHAQWLNDLV